LFDIASQHDFRQEIAIGEQINHRTDYDSFAWLDRVLHDVLSTLREVKVGWAMTNEMARLPKR
jgi:hypothetical protein